MSFQFNLRLLKAWRRCCFSETSNLTQVVRWPECSFVPQSAIFRLEVRDFHREKEKFPVGELNAQTTHDDGNDNRWAKEDIFHFTHFVWLRKSLRFHASNTFWIQLCMKENEFFCKVIHVKSLNVSNRSWVQTTCRVSDKSRRLVTITSTRKH